MNPFDFGPLIRARFLARPNRFLLHCMLPEGKKVKAFLPNPGRLWELLLPDAAVLLADHGNSERKTRYTAVAVERGGAPVFLHTHVNNAVARRLLERRRVPGLEDASIVRAEAPLGRSRFDFLLRDRYGDLYLEVKSCTLFGHGVAMFPDAVTERGRRHLLELAELARAGTRAAVLFVVHTPAARWFMPDYHTDLAFSRTLLEVRRDVRILPVAVSWTRALRPGRTARLLDIPWEHIEREARDRGSYLLIVRLRWRRRIVFGAQPPALFQPGYYVYVGSGMAYRGAQL